MIFYFLDWRYWVIYKIYPKVDIIQDLPCASPLTKRVRHVNVEASKDGLRNALVHLGEIQVLSLKSLYSRHLSIKLVLLAPQNLCYLDLLKLSKGLFYRICLNHFEYTNQLFPVYQYCPLFLCDDLWGHRWYRYFSAYERNCHYLQPCGRFHWSHQAHPHLLHLIEIRGF